MKLAIFLFAVSFHFGQAAINELCLRQTQPFGDSLNSTNSVNGTDLDILRNIKDSETYKVSAIITCLKNNQITGIRLGVSNLKSTNSSQIYSVNDTIFLTTFGAPTVSGAICSFDYFPVNTYIKTLKIYYTKGSGILGMLFVQSNGVPRVFGDITGSEINHSFTPDRVFAGLSGVTALSNNTKTNIASLGVLSLITDPNMCELVVVTPPPSVKLTVSTKSNDTKPETKQSLAGPIGIAIGATIGAVILIIILLVFCGWCIFCCYQKKLKDTTKQGDVSERQLLQDEEQIGHIATMTEGFDEEEFKRRQIQNTERTLIARQLVREVAVRAFERIQARNTLISQYQMKIALDQAFKQIEIIEAKREFEEKERLQKQEEEKRIYEEQQAILRAEEERKRNEAEAKRLQDEKKKAEVEAQRVQEEERKKAEAETRRIEQERKLAEEEAKIVKEDSTETRRILEEARLFEEAERVRLEEEQRLIKAIEDEQADNQAALEIEIAKHSIKASEDVEIWDNPPTTNKEEVEQVIDFITNSELVPSQSRESDRDQKLSLVDEFNRRSSMNDNSTPLQDEQIVRDTAILPLQFAKGGNNKLYTSAINYKQKSIPEMSISKQKTIQKEKTIEQSAIKSQNQNILSKEVNLEPGNLTTRVPTNSYDYKFVKKATLPIEPPKPVDRADWFVSPPQVENLPQTYQGKLQVSQAIYKPRHTSQVRERFYGNLNENSDIDLDSQQVLSDEGKKEKELYSPKRQPQLFQAPIISLRYERSKGQQGRSSELMKSVGHSVIARLNKIQEQYGQPVKASSSMNMY